MTPYPSPEVTGNVVVLSLNACATLTFLDPLPKDLENLCIERTIAFYRLPPVAGGDNASPTNSAANVASPASSPPTSPHTPGKGEREPPTNPGLIIAAFNEFLASILFMESTISCLTRQFKVYRSRFVTQQHLMCPLQCIEPFLRAPEPHCRERAVSTVLALLRKFVDFKSKVRDPLTCAGFAATCVFGFCGPHCAIVWLFSALTGAHLRIGDEYVFLPHSRVFPRKPATSPTVASRTWASTSPCSCPAAPTPTRTCVASPSRRSR